MMGAGPLNSLVESGDYEWREIFIYLGLAGIVISVLVLIIVENNLDKKDSLCANDLEKYSTEKCGVFYYGSLKEFYEKNPDCCDVDKDYLESKVNDFFNSFFGRYLFYLRKKSESAYSYYTDSCGTFVDIPDLN
jgi:hypothetical protein